MTPSDYAICLKDVGRDFLSGDTLLQALTRIDLQIRRGEMVAIMGASGSGKSTLMNIIGCLDGASRGEVYIHGEPLHNADQEKRALIRSQRIGFIFQRYHLIPFMSAEENVLVPAQYQCWPEKARRERAQLLLARLGLAERKHHRPSTLSGGQQQRVSVARALMNGADIILADEPTGALDKASGEQLMAELKALHQAGRTVVIVTHDRNVARQTERIIEISEGAIVSDAPSASRAAVTHIEIPHINEHAVATFMQRLRSALLIAWRALCGHPGRALLSMLGIIIGISAVIISVAVGEGARQTVLDEMSRLGTQAIDIYPGSQQGSIKKYEARPLTEEEMMMLTRLPEVAAVSPQLSTFAMVNYAGKIASLTVNGVGENKFAVSGATFLAGRGFTPEERSRNDAVIVINSALRDALFPSSVNPIGEVIYLGIVPFRVIGVATMPGIGYSDNQNESWIPWTTLKIRLGGKQAFDNFSVRVTSGYHVSDIQQRIERLFASVRGVSDIYTRSNIEFIQAVDNTSRSLNLLITSIAAISLLVGGIGVMNIMLVSVTERVYEIGIRLSVGARPADIMLQFIIEAMVICLLGGTLGVLIAVAGCLIVPEINPELRMIMSWQPIILACLFSILIGLLFGFFPARRAAALNPVEALAKE